MKSSYPDRNISFNCFSKMQQYLFLLQHLMKFVEMLFRFIDKLHPHPQTCNPHHIVQSCEIRYSLRKPLILKTHISIRSSVTVSYNLLVHIHRLHSLHSNRICMYVVYTFRLCCWMRCAVPAMFSSQMCVCAQLARSKRAINVWPNGYGQTTALPEQHGIETDVCLVHK